MTLQLVFFSSFFGVFGHEEILLHIQFTINLCPNAFLTSIAARYISPGLPKNPCLKPMSAPDAFGTKD